MRHGMKENTKKYLIYIRYLLPIFTDLVIFAMLFVPSYRFIFSGKAGELMSGAKLISNSWDQVRNILFGTAEQTDAAMIFSKILFALIIILAIVFLLSLAVSIWSATVAFRCFLSDGEDAENSRRVFKVFIPNRIVLCIITSLGLAITLLPYLMKPLYAFTYSQQVTAVLEAPDALIAGGVLVLATIVLSIICAPSEKAFDADIFKKDSDDTKTEDASYDDEEKHEDMDDESKKRIRHLFDEDKDK